MDKSGDTLATIEMLVEILATALDVPCPTAQDVDTEWVVKCAYCGQGETWPSENPSDHAADCSWRRQREALAIYRQRIHASNNNP